MPWDSLENLCEIKLKRYDLNPGWAVIAHSFYQPQPPERIAPRAGRFAVTGSLEAVSTADLLGWLADRDAELEFSSIYGNQHLELRVKGGGIRSVALGDRRLYDRATVLGLGASLAAVRRGAFELRAPRDSPTERELGVAFVSWLLSAISGSDDVLNGAL